MILISLISFFNAFLNTPSGQFCDFGTSFLDANQSMLLSSRTGYISTPLTHRVKNINEITLVADLFQWI